MTTNDDPNDWTAYRIDRLKTILSIMTPTLSAMEACLMSEIEIAEVNEVFQRFKDFQHDVAEIKAKYGLNP